MTTRQAPGRRLDYMDFVVSVSPAGGEQVRVEVLRSPAGETQSLTELPVEWGVLQADLAELRLPFVEQIQLVEMGQALYDLLFPRDILSLWDRSLGSAKASRKGLNLILRVEDARLAQLPWELLCHEGRFLVPSVNTPLIRYVPVEAPVDALTVTPPLRVLVAISSPAGHAALNVEREKEWITQALRPLIERNAVSVEVLAPATRHGLQQKLRQEYHVLHYIGHGDLDTTTENGFLVFTRESTQEPDPLDAETLSYLLEGSSIRLIFLNACQTAVTNGQEAFLGVAQSLVGVGLPAVVAMQFDVPDTSAAGLSRAFYGSLADGFPVQAAVSEGRKAVLSRDSRFLKDWATPTLFMRSPSGVLFETAPVREENESDVVTDWDSLEGRKTLRQVLDERFTLEGFKDLCADLDIDYDNLPGTAKSAKARELVDYLRRRNQLERLVEAIRQTRDDIEL